MGIFREKNPWLKDFLFIRCVIHFGVAFLKINISKDSRVISVIEFQGLRYVSELGGTAF